MKTKSGIPDKLDQYYPWLEQLTESLAVNVRGWPLLRAPTQGQHKDKYLLMTNSLYWTAAVIVDTARYQQNTKEEHIL